MDHLTPSDKNHPGDPKKRKLFKRLRRELGFFLGLLFSLFQFILHALASFLRLASWMEFFVDGVKEMASDL
ncbi:hypothetical protein BZA70DRAFT_291140 [Myxozyma melibiosi]|uniref:Uncharacterized protein n=1 Tax=Myxozyma melibiosi TaxID=54550 RepID=A0ABR1F131_9ASCO